MLLQKGHTKGYELDRAIDRQLVNSAYKPHEMPVWACQLTTDRTKYLSEKSGGLYHKNVDVPKTGLRGDRASEQVLV